MRGIKKIYETRKIYHNVGGNMQYLACHLSLAQMVQYLNEQEQDFYGTGEVLS